MSTRDTPAQIGDLPPIGRPANAALLHVGISTLEQVATLTEEQLADLHGVGPKAVRILKQALADQGRDFAPPQG